MLPTIAHSFSEEDLQIALHSLERAYGLEPECWQVCSFLGRISANNLDLEIIPGCFAGSAGLFGKSTVGLRTIAAPTRELLNVTHWSSLVI